MATTLNTKLVKDGNSKAVRLNSTVLQMSGLSDDIELEVRKGEVILRPSNNRRKNWDQLIAEEISNNPKALSNDPELEDWDVAVNDGLN